MAETQYCTVADVTDIIPSSIVGDNDGQISEARLTRIIEKCSARIEYWNNKVPFAETTVTNEYHELVGLDKFALDRSPVISITTLEIQLADDSWEEQTQGRDDNTDDYFLENSNWGLIRFHGVPNKKWCRVTYKHGYETNPLWLRDLCSKMVACDVFKLKTYDEQCETMFKYWMDEIREYRREIDEYKKRINRRKMKAKTIGARWATTPIDELRDVRKWMK